MTRSLELLWKQGTSFVKNRATRAPSVDVEPDAASVTSEHRGGGGGRGGGEVSRGDGGGGADSDGGTSDTAIKNSSKMPDVDDHGGGGGGGGGGGSAGAREGNQVQTRARAASTHILDLSEYSLRVPRVLAHPDPTVSPHKRARKRLRTVDSDDELAAEVDDRGGGSGGRAHSLGRGGAAAGCNDDGEAGDSAGSGGGSYEGDNGHDGEGTQLFFERGEAMLLILLPHLGFYERVMASAGTAHASPTIVRSPAGSPHSRSNARLLSFPLLV